MEVLDLVVLLRDDSKTPPAMRLGVIPADYASGPAPVRFDGEGDPKPPKPGEEPPARKRYKVADHVTLAAGKTVLVAMVGNSGVIVAAWTRP